MAGGGATRRIPQDSLPLRLVMLRHEAHISQRQAAFRCGITPRVWQGMEEGRATANLLDVLQTIADEFDYDRDWLAYGGELAKKSPRRPDGPDGGVEPPGGIEPPTYSLRVIQQCSKRPTIRRAGNVIPLVPNKRPDITNPDEHVA